MIYREFGRNITEERRTGRPVNRKIWLSFPWKYSVHFGVGPSPVQVSVMLRLLIYSAVFNAAVLVNTFSIVHNSQTTIRNTWRELAISASPSPCFSAVLGLKDIQMLMNVSSKPRAIICRHYHKGLATIRCTQL